MFKKFFLLILTIFITTSFVFASESYTLKAGISIDKIPKEFYGTWRVTSKLLSSNNAEIFRENSVDLWNLSRVGDVITLDNPFSGAHASIMVNEVSDRLIKFQKIGAYDDSRKLTDIVELTLAKDTFTGINKLKFDTISQADGHVIKSDTAKYRLTGEKISGDSINK